MCVTVCLSVCLCVRPSVSVRARTTSPEAHVTCGSVRVVRNYAPYMSTSERAKVQQLTYAGLRARAERAKVTMMI